MLKVKPQAHKAQKAPMETAPPEALGFSAERLERIPHFFKDYIDQGKLSGLSILVARRNKVAHWSVQGFADLESRTPLREDSIFRIYSMSKPITSVGLMMLFEEGLFRLDDPVSKYLPEFGKMQVWSDGNNLRWKVRGPLRPVSCHDLLTHRSGLTYGFLHAHPVDRLYRHAKIAERGFTLEETLARLSDLPLLFDPGTAWNYSVSTDMCGRLIEVLSGQSLDAYFEERLFKPLGMVDTAFAVPSEKAERLTSLYDRAAGEKTLRAADPAAKSAFLQMPRFLSGGGGLVSTMEDYYRFCSMLAEGGLLEGVRFLSPNTVSFMMQNHLPENKTLSDMSFGALFSENPMEGTGFGLGGSVILDNSALMMPVSRGTFSWGGAASTYFWIDPAQEMIGIMMTQFMPSDHYPIRAQLLQQVYGALIE